MQAFSSAKCTQACMHKPVCTSLYAQACMLQTKSVDDILLNFPEHGVHLIFESSSQKLRLIEVYDLSRLQVRLLSHSFGRSLTRSLLHSLTHSLGMCLLHSCVNRLCTTTLLCTAAVCMFHCCCNTKQEHAVARLNTWKCCKALLCSTGKAGCSYSRRLCPPSNL